MSEAVQINHSQLSQSLTTISTILALCYLRYQHLP